VRSHRATSIVSAPIRFVAIGSGVSIVSGAGPDAEAVRLQNVSHVVVEGFTMRSGVNETPVIQHCVAARGSTVAQPMRGIGLDGVDGAVIQNNLIHNNGRDAVRAYRSLGAAGPKHLRVVNNSLTAVAQGVEPGEWAIRISEDAGGHIIFNNILSGRSGALAVGSLTLQSNNNAGADKYSTDSGATVLTLAAWRTASGQDANSRVAIDQQLFVNPDTRDYRTHVNSVAAGAGIASLGGFPAPQNAIDGLSRPRGSPTFTARCAMPRHIPESLRQ
jgi:hypothetical protein